MRPRALFLVLLVVTVCVCVFADETYPAHLDALLQGPDRSEIRCSLKLTKPVLMYQQQYLVIAQARFSKKVVERGEAQNLEFLVKLRDGDGKWIDGAVYNHFKAPRDAPGHEVVFETAVYLRPGTYELVLVVFNSQLQTATVFHRSIRIHPLKHDPLPQLDQHLPVAELPNQLRLRGDLWPVSLKTSRIPIEASQPTRLDIVLNVTQRSPSGWLYRLDTERALGIGSVLGRLEVDRGCVRVSIIDALRSQVIIDRKNARHLSWKRVQELVERIDQNVIDVEQLGNQTKIAGFVQDFAQKLAADTETCGEGAASLRPVVVVVSHEVAIPNKATIQPFVPSESGEYFYVHLGYRGGWMDAVGKTLSSGKTEKLNCSSPKDVREAIAKIVRSISTAPQ